MFAAGFGLIIAMAVLSAEIDQGATEIDGDWKLVSVRTDGHEDLDEKTAKEERVVLRLNKGEGRLTENPKPGEPADADAKDSEDTEDEAKIEYRLNPTKDPKQIDWVFKDADDEKDRTFQGIYRLKDDELVICFSVAESNDVIDDVFGGGGPQYDIVPATRPTTFEPSLKSIWTFKRAPAAKSSP